MAKKKQSVESLITKVTGKAAAPYKRVVVASCEPNDWNPNKLDEESRRKLTKGMKRLLDNGVPLPPIIVRPHPTKDDTYQIIDGFHRWDILRAEGYEEVDAYVLDVDTQTAMILTDTLNYLRGTPDPDLHAEYLHRLLQDTKLPLPEASEYLPYTETEIRAYLDAAELELIEIEPPPVENPEGDDDPGDAFLTLKFVVSREQAEIIEREIARTAALLKGKNLRGRALEFIAVNSSQTEPGNLTGEEEAEPATVAPSNGKIKKRLQETARGR